MEPYIHKKTKRLITEAIPTNAPVCYLTLRAEAILDRNLENSRKKELYTLIRLTRKKALRMEARLRHYREAIESLGFIRNIS